MFHGLLLPRPKVIRPDISFNPQRHAANLFHARRLRGRLALPVQGEIAARFGAIYPQDLAVPSQTVEGLMGLAIFEADGTRMLRMMRWGFPRRARGGVTPCSSTAM